MVEDGVCTGNRTESVVDDMPSATNTVTMMKTELKRKKNMVLILLALSSMLFLVPAYVIAEGTG